MSPPLPKFITSLFSFPTQQVSVLHFFTAKEINENNLPELNYVHKLKFSFNAEIKKFPFPRKKIFIINEEGKLTPLFTHQDQQDEDRRKNQIDRTQDQATLKAALKEEEEKTDDILAMRISGLSNNLAVQRALVEIFSSDILPPTHPVTKQLQNENTKRIIAEKLQVPVAQVSVIPEHVITLIPENNNKIRIQTITNVTASISVNPDQKNVRKAEKLLMKLETTYCLAPVENQQKKNNDEMAQLSVVSHKEIGNARLVKELLLDYKISVAPFGRGMYVAPQKKQTRPISTTLFKPDLHLEKFITTAKKSLSIIFKTNQKTLLAAVYSLPTDTIDSISPESWDNLGHGELRKLKQEINYFLQSLSEPPKESKNSNQSDPDEKELLDDAETPSAITNFKEQVKQKLKTNAEKIQKSLQRAIVHRNIDDRYATQQLPPKLKITSSVINTFVQESVNRKALFKQPSLALIGDPPSLHNPR